ncbi:hypothetical protein ACIPL1_09845 [Pseudomonas sp. NPDC090202]|uniref:DUF7079 family protein n=1 Tax=unclassified Pseudomonas TaxID=196821 RepID=UPI00381C3418
MTKSEDAKLWMELSDLFIDTEIEYACIARRIADFSVEEIEFAVFYRVAPICVWNMMTAIPPVWAGFSEEIISEIEGLIEIRRRRGWWGRISATWTALWMRLFCLPIWPAFKAELIKVKQSKGAD